MPMCFCRSPSQLTHPPTDGTGVTGASLGAAGVEASGVSMQLMEQALAAMGKRRAAMGKGPIPQINQLL